MARKVLDILKRGMNLTNISKVNMIAGIASGAICVALLLVDKPFVASFLAALSVVFCLIMYLFNKEIDNSSGYKSSVLSALGISILALISAVSVWYISEVNEDPFEILMKRGVNVSEDGLADVIRSGDDVAVNLFAKTNVNFTNQHLLVALRDTKNEKVRKAIVDKFSNKLLVACDFVWIDQISAGIFGWTGTPAGQLSWQTMLNEIETKADAIFIKNICRSSQIENKIQSFESADILMNDYYSKRRIKIVSLFRQ